MPSDRPLGEIAAEIEEAWDAMPPKAAEWVDAMSLLDSVDDLYYETDGRFVVQQFLNSSRRWRDGRGEAIRDELSGLLGL